MHAATTAAATQDEIAKAALAFPAEHGKRHGAGFVLFEAACRRANGWSIERLARRSKASAIRDNSYTTWSLTANRCKTTARRRQDCKMTHVVTATARNTSAKNCSCSVMVMVRPKT